MADVAARAGVSRALVSTVFRGVPGASEATRQRVLAAARELDYRMDNRARSLRRSRTRLLGVSFRLHDAYHADLVQALYAQAALCGYGLVLSAVLPDPPLRSDQQAIDSLLDERCEGLLLVAPQLQDVELDALGRRLPTVVLSRPLVGVGCDVVRTDDGAVMRLALEHLARLGHRDVVHLDGGGLRSSAERRQAFAEQVAQLGMTGRVLAGGTGPEAGSRATAQLLDQDRMPSAVVTFDDSQAIGLILALRQKGVRVPDQVSVVGFDDIQLAAAPPIGLTTVAQDVTGTAQRALDLVVDRLDHGAQAGRQLLVPPYLVGRHSTGPPPSPGPSTDRGGH